MSSDPTPYDTGVTDSGDETDRRPEAEASSPGPWIARFDATYWQAQAETAIRALEQALATLARMEAERDAALRQCTTLKADLGRAHSLAHEEIRSSLRRRRRGA